MCLANMALVAASATSGGGLTALMMSKLLRKEKQTKSRGTKNETARDGDRNEPNEHRIGN
jgi:hypothetical protein